ISMGPVSLNANSGLSGKESTAHTMQAAEGAGQAEKSAHGTSAADTASLTKTASTGVDAATSAQNSVGQTASQGNSSKMNAGDDITGSHSKGSGQSWSKGEDASLTDSVKHSRNVRFTAESNDMFEQAAAAIPSANSFERSSLGSAFDNHNAAGMAAYHSAESAHGDMLGGISHAGSGMGAAESAMVADLSAGRGPVNLDFGGANPSAGVAKTTGAATSALADNRAFIKSSANAITSTVNNNATQANDFVNSYSPLGGSVRATGNAWGFTEGTSTATGIARTGILVGAAGNLAGVVAVFAK
ncbi:hypothetical protein, partial [Paraburkholderia sp. UCT31]|uniref:hypothetical protein n=1 Tax=Paraburkholderia sp. UCT31 TaxID=2615209 RepID=UPI001654EFCB